jgi:LacI family transcriptional regulator
LTRKSQPAIIWKTFSGKGFPYGFNLNRLHLKSVAKLVSLQNVAHAAGVSLTTASRVLNNSSHPVNPSTAGRVLSAAERLGYSPNALARALVTQRSGIIGVLVGDNADPYFARIVHGIHGIVQSRGSLVIVCNTLRNPRTVLNYIAMLDSYNADGILLVGGAHTEPEYSDQIQTACERYCQNGGHIVTLSEYPLPAPRVGIDNVKASHDMACYLIALGHEQIAYVRGPENLRTTGLREQGFRQAMLESGLSICPELVVTGDFSFESGVAAMNILLDLPERPTAVFAANDLTAIGCVVAALQRGLRVPQELSVAGMDNIESTQYLTPQLTTVEVPMLEMGRQAAACLFSMVEDEPFAELTVLPHNLVIRGTTAPPVSTTPPDPHNPS